ncbi:MAG: phage shock protein PspA [Candidatus Sumerlaeota bacterium]|nr:phage shock protein PspA [Candidatus Sumerlaeota bacterium]
MGIFTRMRDIISSNINAMLDRAENPEKLIRLMIQEMEDTLVEIKAQCASAMAQSKNMARQGEDAFQRVRAWADKARLAVEKGFEDLAREALVEKRHSQQESDAYNAQIHELNDLIQQYHKDIVELEGKIAGVREKQQVLGQRHAHAQVRRRAQNHIRRADTSDVMSRFDSLERRVDRMEAEADLVNVARKPNLDERFSEIEGGEEIEKELAGLKEEVKGKPATDKK